MERTAGVDVELPLQIGTADVANGQVSGPCLATSTGAVSARSTIYRSPSRPSRRAERGHSALPLTLPTESDFVPSRPRNLSWRVSPQPTFCRLATHSSSSIASSMLCMAAISSAILLAAVRIPPSTSTRSIALRSEAASGSRSAKPAPAASTFLPFRGWSANSGRTTTGRPSASPPRSVPDPPWQRKAVACGHTSPWGTHASIATFAGGGPRDEALMFGPVVRSARTGISDTVFTTSR